MVIVAAVDESDRAQSVVREAERIANAFDEIVHVVHALNPSETEVREAAEKRNESNGLQDRAANIAKKSYADQDLRCENVGLIGKPEEKIIEYAGKHNARYIVVSPRKRSPAGKVMFGSVAQSILLNSEVPVLTIVEQ